MSKQVTVYLVQSHRRSAAICNALVKGLRHCGWTPIVRPAEGYTRPETAVSVFYGLGGKLHNLLKHSQNSDHTAVYIDLGYWGRRKSTRWDGYHKVAVNSRHPTMYFQKIQHPEDRLNKVGVRVKPWRNPGNHVLLAGMGNKAAKVEGYGVEQWERRAIAELRKHTDRPIVYRPKPSWRTAKPIPGTDYHDPNRYPLEDALSNCHAVVTHHSNVGVDGLVFGLPVFSACGVASVMGRRTLACIEDPLYPEDRIQWAANVAYTQWSVHEMERGLMWRYLLDEGLVK